MNIYVRRGGPNYQTGLAKMRSLGEELGVPIEVSYSYFPSRKKDCSFGYSVPQEGMNLVSGLDNRLQKKLTPLVLFQHLICQ